MFDMCEVCHAKEFYRGGHGTESAFYSCSQKGCETEMCEVCIRVAFRGGNTSLVSQFDYMKGEFVCGKHSTVE